MSEKIQNVVGRGLYLELASSDSTVQLLFIPEMATASKHVPMSVYRRRISATQPRSVWKYFYTSVKSTPNADGTFAAASLGIAKLNAKMKLDFTNKIFSQLVKIGYKVRIKPIVFEISYDDIQDVLSQKTPYKILNRVNKARKALGFPESVI